MDALIVLAGGSGSRVGGDRNKVYEEAAGRPLLWYPIEALIHFGETTRLVMVIRAADRGRAEEVISDFRGLDCLLVEGGATRFESEQAGLDAVAELVESDELIGIHDAARPFLTIDLWESCLRAAGATGAAIPLQSAETLYYLDERRLQRLSASAHKAQTPQVFRAAGLLSAFKSSRVPGIDTAETVMRLRTLRVAAVPGDRRNIKVTFPADLEAAHELAGLWRAGRWLTTA